MLLDGNRELVDDARTVTPELIAAARAAGAPIGEVLASVGYVGALAAQGI